MLSVEKHLRTCGEGQYKEEKVNKGRMLGLLLETA